MKKKSTKLVTRENHLTFSRLISAIQETDRYFASQASKSVNVSLTLRNWVIGFYIREYEQNGSDRANYGQQLLVRLSGQLEKTGSLKYDPRELRRCRAFYDVYPQLWGTVSPKLGVPPEKLLTNLSFSHFAELIELDDPLKRVFYEIESVRVRHLWNA